MPPRLTALASGSVQRSPSVTLGRHEMPAARGKSATVGYRQPRRIIGALVSIGAGVLMGVAMVQKFAFMASCDALVASSFYVSMSIPIAAAAAAALGVVLLLVTFPRRSGPPVK